MAAETKKKDAKEVKLVTRLEDLGYTVEDKGNVEVAGLLA